MNRTSHDEDGVMSTGERLVYMANQIARNVAAQGPDAAADTVVDHIRSYWDPAMRVRIVELAKADPTALTPIAAAAVARIAGG